MTPGPDRRLGPVERTRLTLEILVTYARARRLMHAVDLATALERLRGTPPPPGTPLPAGELSVHVAQRMGRAVMLVLARLPTDRRCLIRSLVVSALLARRGIEGQLVIGVRPQASEPFKAHAWVELGDRPILPTEGYSRLHAL